MLEHLDRGHHAGVLMLENVAVKHKATAGLIFVKLDTDADPAVDRYRKIVHHTFRGYAPARNLKGLDVAAAIAAADSKACRGKFASGRVSELVDSDVVFRGFASCDDSSGIRVTQYFIVPRSAGGFVIFSLSATGKASQPPSVTEGENLTTLRKAALVSVQKK